MQSLEGATQRRSGRQPSAVLQTKTMAAGSGDQGESSAVSDPTTVRDNKEDPPPSKPAPRSSAGRTKRDGRSSLDAGSNILGQQAPKPENDSALKKYYELPQGANAVVLYNSKAVSRMYQGNATSNGVSFRDQGMSILGDASGNAEKNPRMIDISEPGWMRKLDALVATNGKFEHVFVLDHGNVGRVAFGAHPKSYPEFTGPDKDSGAARVVADALADKGALHLGSCLTGGEDTGRQYLEDLHKTMNRGNNISIDAITGVMQNRLNQFDGKIIRVSKPPQQPAPTPYP